MTRVLLGVPTLNGPARLKRLLESVRQAPWPSRLAVKMLVCDDGSTPENLAENKRLVTTVYQDLHARCATELLMPGGRNGIARTWNLLCRHSPDWEVGLLLNDDVELARHAIEAVVYTLEENERAGMVGLNSYVSLTREQHKSVYPAGRLEHEVFPRIDYVESQMLSGSGNLLASNGPAFGFRRAVYEYAGGFDERYFVFYEELDFGVTLRRLGFEHFMLSYPILYHMGGATNSVPSNLDARARMEESAAKFHEKWGKTPGELREEFWRLAKRDDRPLREWNTHIENWR